MQSRFSWDDLRRFAASLMAKRGLAPAKASALATHQLWFDAAGAPSWGIARLAAVLEAIERKDWNVLGEAKFESERAAIAAINGQNGVPPLLAAQAAATAGEKARDFGIGRVRLRNIDDPGPLAPFVAELAIGPQIAMMIGPGPHWAFAMPSAHGLPWIYDSQLASASADADAGARAFESDLARWFAPWLALQRGREWIALAMILDASDPLEALHQRLAELVADPEQGERAGWIDPQSWADRRMSVQLRGVPVDEDVREFLDAQARAHGIDALRE